MLDITKIDLRKIKERMFLEGWTQNMVASKAGVSPATVSNFLTGKRIRNHLAHSIVTACGFTMREVVKGRVA